MPEIVYSAGECPACLGFGTVLFVSDLLSGRIFFLCPACGVAWPEVPETGALDAVDRPENFAPTGIGLPTKDELDRARVADRIQEELDYEYWAESLAAYLGEQGGGCPVNARDKLIDMMRRVRMRQLPIDEFCRKYEHVWNFERRSAEIDAREGKVLERVFDVVVWYSPYEEEREEYPGYKSEAAVLGAVDRALRELG